MPYTSYHLSCHLCVSTYRTFVCKSSPILPFTSLVEQTNSPLPHPILPFIFSPNQRQPFKIHFNIRGQKPITLSSVHWFYEKSIQNGSNEKYVYMTTASAKQARRRSGVYVRNSARVRIKIGSLTGIWYFCSFLHINFIRIVVGDISTNIILQVYIDIRKLPNVKRLSLNALACIAASHELFVRHSQSRRHPFIFLYFSFILFISHDS